LIDHFQNRRNYAAAIQSFQVSLRADTEDHSSWLRLGEAYTKAGKHAAAMKALNRARELQPDDWISLYLIGEVNCQIGQFKVAIVSFESILLSQPMELAVLLSLSNAYLDLGREEAVNGFTSSAEASFLSSIETAVKAIDSNPGYRRVAWKIVADSFYHLSDFASFTETVQVHDVLVAVKNLIKSSPSERLSKLSITPLKIEATGLGVLDFAVAAHDFRMTFGFHDDRAKASAWFDLGISLQLWSKRNDRNDHRKEALEQGINCLKQAVLADPSNEASWIALGHAHFETNAKSAQHAYIRALEINSKVVLFCHTEWLFIHLW
jgi:superkiller protein 3